MPGALVCAAMAAFGAVPDNASLSGSYYFRHVLLVTDGVNVIQTFSASGTMIFNGTGNFTFTGQKLEDITPPAAFSGAGTYAVKSTGVVTFTNPLRAGASVNARLGAGALVGSSTEAGATVFDVFIAIPAPAAPVTGAGLSGVYRVSTLEFPGAGVINVRNTNTRLTFNGAGAVVETSVTGQARNLGNQLLTQSVGSITYSVAPDLTGTLNFPAGSPTSQLAEGVKNIYVSGDATFFIGGSLATGGHGLVVGVKSFPSGAVHDSWSGFFHAAGLRFDADRSRLTGTTGSLNVVTPGVVWARRTRQPDGVLDASILVTYALDGEGSGPLLSTSGQVSLASTGDTFSTTGVAANSTTYELSFGVRMPAVSGPGVFIDPQRVLNAANYGLGYPLSPGGFFSIFGTGLATQTATAPGLPYPKTLGGVSVKVNGLDVPLHYVSPGLINGIVPFAAAGSTATVVVTSNGVASNAVEVALAPTAPGIFTMPQNGLGDGATLHADYTLVSPASPAKAGEIVLVFLAGMGAVNPSVQDGQAAPWTEPLARALAPLRVTVDGVECTVHFSGLAPYYAGLYQLNIQLPYNLAPGTHSLAIQTVDAFTDMANLVSGP
jgi:uncharacterized protein (TIGR03437 family)